MIRVVSWNINRSPEAWRELSRMAAVGQADVALLQETGKCPPDDVVDRGGFEFEDVAQSFDRGLGAKLDRWPAVVKLSDRVEVEWFEQVPATPLAAGQQGTREMGVSGVGTLAAAKVTLVDGRGAEPLIAVSMYAAWLHSRPSPRTGPWIYSDASAHRILSDLSVFTASSDPSKDRILAAGDLNMFYGATGHKLSLPKRERTVWNRFRALGLRFLGPQWPNASRQACGHPTDVPSDTKNVPTYFSVPHRQSPATAKYQLDYAFASRGFHRSVRVHAMNGIDEWGPSDHCRLMIEIDCG